MNTKTQRISEGQWRWCWERFCEGYPITEIAAFLGVHRVTVSRQFAQMGLRAEFPRELPDLEDRREEFNHERFCT